MPAGSNPYGWETKSAPSQPKLDTMTYASLAAAIIVTLAILEYPLHSERDKKPAERIRELKENIVDIALFAPLRAWHLIEVTALRLIGLDQWYFGRRLLRAIHGKDNIPREELEKITPRAFKLLNGLLRKP